MNAIAMSLSDYPDLSEKTYRTIKDLVVNGVLHPGQELVVVELAEQLGVSRTPVKDALNRLSAERLVHHEPRKGYLVSALCKEDVAELMDARVLIEQAAVAKGILSIQDADVRQMRQIVTAMESCIDESGEHYRDYAEFLMRDCELHYLIVRTARNRRLNDVYETLNVHSYMVRMHNAASIGDLRVQSALREHKAILAAFEARDLAALQRAIEVNISSFVSFFRQLHA